MTNHDLDRQVINQVMRRGRQSLVGDQALIKHALDGSFAVQPGTVADVLVVDEVAQRHINRRFADGSNEAVDETITQRRWGLRVTR